MPGLAFAPELNDIARMLARDLGGIKDGTLGKIRGYCAGCNDPIRDSDTVTFAQNAMYHQEHFQCETCRSPLLNVNYHVHDEQPMCSNCFADTVLPKCAGCRKAIAADMVSLLGTQFHPDCLTCALCRTGLVGKPVFPDQDGTTTDSAAVVPAVLCQSCYENKHAPECSRCTKKILPMAAGSKAEYVVVNGRKFHSTCFVCYVRFFFITTCESFTDFFWILGMRNSVHGHASVCPWRSLLLPH
ncbi:hypothetical protein BC828DRAFT_164237 [Blastocladiella britannica]|nr:hypothetical protein BC828DRAFT_164237 [Blastocladiella britannica]